MEFYTYSDTSAEDTLSHIPNPVGYLQELCVKRGFTLPEYGILKQDGPSHNPIFSTFCQVQEHYRLASSNSKKKGKEMAARAVIMCIKKSKFKFLFISFVLCKTERMNFEILLYSFCMEHIKGSLIRSENLLQ